MLDGVCILGNHCHETVQILALIQLDVVKRQLLGLKGVGKVERITHAQARDNISAAIALAQKMMVTTDTKAVTMTIGMTAMMTIACQATMVGCGSVRRSRWPPVNSR